MLQDPEKVGACGATVPALVHASQHVLGSGDEDGTWLLEVQRATQGTEPLLICTFTAIPWFFQAWLHTLKVTVDGAPVPLKEVRIACQTLRSA